MQSKPFLSPTPLSLPNNPGSCQCNSFLLLAAQFCRSHINSTHLHYNWPYRLLCMGNNFITNKPNHCSKQWSANWYSAKFTVHATLSCLQKLIQQQYKGHYNTEKQSYAYWKIFMSSTWWIMNYNKLDTQYSSKEMYWGLTSCVSGMAELLSLEEDELPIKCLCLWSSLHFHLLESNESCKYPILFIGFEELTWNVCNDFGDSIVKLLGSFSPSSKHGNVEPWLCWRLDCEDPKDMRSWSVGWTEGDCVQSKGLTTVCISDDVKGSLKLLECSHFCIICSSELEGTGKRKLSSNADNPAPGLSGPCRQSESHRNERILFLCLGPPAVLYISLVPVDVCSRLCCLLFGL